jgi:hypothetical protein
MKSNLTAVLGAERFRPGHHFADGIEHDLELLVVFVFERREFARELNMRCEQLPKLHKRPHDRDIHLNSPRASQHA